MKSVQPVDLEERIGCLRTALALRPEATAVHYNLGIALTAKNQMDEAIFEFNQAIKCDPKFAPAHVMLGNRLKAKNQMDDAIDEYKKAIVIDPKLAEAYYNLGIALVAMKRLEEAIEAYKSCLKLRSNDALGWLNLGAALCNTNRLDEAIGAYQAALHIDPNLVNANAAIGQALLHKGRFAEARNYTQNALERLPEKDRLRPNMLRQRELCDVFLALEAKLPDVLAGKAKINDNGERVGLIQICRLQHRYVAATKLCADAFTADAKLLTDLNAAYRYNAACYAALAAAGQGTDADKLDDQERSRLRKQALAWLRADLGLWGNRLAEGKPADRKLALDTLRHWQNDSDLSGVRDEAALAKLPPDEQKAFTQLWSDVAVLLKKVVEPK